MRTTAERTTSITIITPAKAMRRLGLSTTHGSPIIVRARMTIPTRDTHLNSGYCTRSLWAERRRGVRTHDCSLVLFPRLMKSIKRRRIKKIASRFDPLPIPQSSRKPLPLFARTKRLMMPITIPPRRALGKDCNCPNIAAVSENKSSSGPRLDPTPPASN